MLPKEYMDYNKTTTNFYKDIQKDFDTSRQFPWKGWERVLNIVKSYIDTDYNDKNNSKSKYSILDMGCGNGRFAKFLEDNLTPSKKDKLQYIGLDNNEFFLEKGRQLVKDFEKGSYSFKEFDFLKDPISNLQKSILEDDAKFDLIFGFGVTHHLTGDIEDKKDWFKHLGLLLEKEGILIFTNWQFLDISSKKMTLEKLEREGDYLLDFSGSTSKRFCHHYSSDDISSILAVLKESNLTLIKRFKSDGRTTNLNEYFVFQKC